MKYIERALLIDDKSHSVYLFKGVLLLYNYRILMEQQVESVDFNEIIDEAVVCFKRSLQLSPGQLFTYSHLIDAYLLQHQTKASLVVVNSLLQRNKKNARILTLVGIVLSHTAEGRPKAAKALHRALDCPSVVNRQL